MIPVWPATLPQSPRRDSLSVSPLPGRAVFEPERGPPIDRAAVTADTLSYSLVFPQVRAAGLVVFQDFYTTALRRGVLPFAWRDPITQAVWRWKIGGDGSDYEVSARGADLYDIGLQILRLPGAPWWQPYVTAPGVPLRLPYAVADYGLSVFGVDLVRGLPAAVAAVSGTFDVYTTATPGGAVTVVTGDSVAPGDIPATAPGGVSKIVAYL